MHESININFSLKFAVLQETYWTTCRSFIGSYSGALVCFPNEEKLFFFVLFVLRLVLLPIVFWVVVTSVKFVDTHQCFGENYWSYLQGGWLKVEAAGFVYKTIRSYILEKNIIFSPTKPPDFIFLNFLKGFISRRCRKLLELQNVEITLFTANSVSELSLPEKPPVAQLLKNSPTRRFITVFTRDLH
jgi:hypothetical protein